MRARLLVILISALLVGPAPQLSPAGIIGISGGARLYVAQPSGAPFDLSAYSIPFTVTWPTPPTTSSTVEVDTCGEFQSAVGSSNVLINVAAGTYSSCNLDIQGDDIDIVMSNSATLQGVVTMDEGPSDRNERIRWTGGNIVAGGEMRFTAVLDLLFDDVHFSGWMSLNRISAAGLSSQRVAFINSTIDGRAVDADFPFFMQQDAAVDFYADLIFANCLFLGDQNTSIRLQQVLRTLVVESYFSGVTEGGTLVTGFRIGENSDGAAILGRDGKPTIIIGRVKNDYVEILPEDYAIINSVWDKIVRYNTTDGGGAAFLNISSNTGTVSNMDTFMNTGVGSPPPGISPFTTGSGVTNVQSWDGTTMPSSAAYGAQR